MRTASWRHTVHFKFDSGASVLLLPRFAVVAVFLKQTGQHFDEAGKSVRVCCPIKGDIERRHQPAVVWS